MTDTTVVVENEGPADGDPDNTNQVLDAVDAHVSAGDAEESAEDAEESAESAETAALASWLAAEESYNAANQSEQAAASNQIQISELREIASSLLAASQNQLEAAQLSRGQAMQQLPEPEAQEEIEPATSGGHWYTKKLWGK